MGNEPKILTLIGRSLDAYGHPQWHDAIVLQAALESISKGKPISEIGRWMRIAGRLQRQTEKAEVGKAMKVTQPTNRDIPDLSQPVTLELHGTEGDLLWDELKKLTPEKFNHDQPIPGGPLACMIEDIATALEKQLPD
jgi:hypothetical protein